MALRPFITALIARNRYRWRQATESLAQSHINEDNAKLEFKNCYLFPTKND